MGRTISPEFDETKVGIGHDHSIYHITYYVYLSDTDTTELPLDKFLKIEEKLENTSNRACFAHLLAICSNFMRKYKRFPNRVRFVCERNKHSKSELHLNTEEIRRWTELCKRNKLMPDNIGNNFIENGCFDIQIDNLSKEMLYVYLSTARYVQDEPFFVRAIIHMVDDNKMGFFTSFAVATTFCTTNTGHHLIDEARTYSVLRLKGTLNSSKDPCVNRFQMLRVAKLAKFVSQPDTAPAISTINTGGTHFTLHSRLNSVKLKTNGGGLIVNKRDLRRKSLERIIVSGDLTTPIVKRKKRRLWKGKVTR